MFGLKKVTVRLIVTIPDNTATIQRLYDYGAWFQLHEERMTDPAKIADFITGLKAKGGQEIAHSDYISDDDFLPRTSIVYEYISVT